MPHIMLNEVNKLSLLRVLKSEQYLSMSFCSLFRLNIGILRVPPVAE